MFGQHHGIRRPLSWPWTDSLRRAVSGSPCIVVVGRHQLLHVASSNANVSPIENRQHHGGVQQVRERLLRIICRSMVDDHIMVSEMESKPQQNGTMEKNARKKRNHVISYIPTTLMASVTACVHVSEQYIFAANANSRRV